MALSSDQNAVNGLTVQVNAARQAMTTALSNYKCELEGPCPNPGFGPIARQKLAIYQQAQQKYDSLSGQLAAATGKLQNEISQREQQDSALNQANTGLPAQIQALFRLGSQDSVLFWTHLAVFLLFFTVEILPVSVKVLLNLGEQASALKDYCQWLLDECSTAGRPGLGRPELALLRTKALDQSPARDESDLLADDEPESESDDEVEAGAGAEPFANPQPAEAPGHPRRWSLRRLAGRLTGTAMNP